MKHKVRIIKRGDRQQPELDPLEQSSPHPVREINATIKLWVSEFKQRRRSEDVDIRLAGHITTRGFICSPKSQSKLN
jgi:hypothetical protein